MTPVPANAFINCRVTSETKVLVRALAAARGVTESALMKELLEAVLYRATLAGPLPMPPERVPRNARLYVRLRDEDWRLLKERAQGRRMASATYVSLLVRSHLRSVAPLPKAEYLALRRSVLELAAIGRNLNQIARQMNQGGTLTLAALPDVDGLLKVIADLRNHFTVLLTANER